MTVEQAMEMVGVDLYFEVMSDGRLIEEGRYDIISRTKDFLVDRIEIIDVNDPESMMCVIYI